MGKGKKIIVAVVALIAIAVAVGLFPNNDEEEIPVNTVQVQNTAEAAESDLFNFDDETESTEDSRTESTTEASATESTTEPTTTEPTTTKPTTTKPTTTKPTTTKPTTTKPTTTKPTTTKPTTTKPTTTSSRYKLRSGQSLGMTVYITATGSKYHYENPCGNGKYSATTLEHALDLGLGPCNKCVLH